MQTFAVFESNERQRNTEALSELPATKLSINMAAPLWLTPKTHK